MSFGFSKLSKKNGDSGPFKLQHGGQIFLSEKMMSLKVSVVAKQHDVFFTSC